MLNYLTKLNIYQCIPIYNLNWIKRKSFYNKILENRIITLVDVGARAGSAEELIPLENHINYIGFDADDQEVKRLNSVKNNYKSSKFINSFVSKTNEEVHFNLHKEPGNSSVYDFSKTYSKWYHNTNANPVERVIKLNANSLDNLVTENVDIIKLDTQGNEFEILIGAQRCLNEALIVEIEVEFVQMYEGQKLAYSVMDLMNSKGFNILYLNRVYGSSNAFLGMSRGQLIFGDALFGLSRERALNLSIDKKLKYCCLLINYGHIDFAYDIFNSCPELRDSSSELSHYFENANRHLSKTFRLIKFITDKLIFVLLYLRKTNGLSSDSDRSWPIR